MILQSLTATFGCFNNATLDLQEGLNVIQAPNESGKSTWLAFLRAMLYGLPASGAPWRTRTDTPPGAEPP